MNRPKTLVCYICGREYGTASLPIHIKSCQKKWEQQQQLLPRNQRRPLPNPPPGLANLMGQNKITMKDVDNLNEQAFDTYNQESLVKCPYCNRTFNQDRIDVHRRICTKDKPFKPLPGATQKNSYDQYPSQQYSQGKGQQKYNQNNYDDDFPMYQKGQLGQKKQNYYEEEEYQKPSKGILKKSNKVTYNDAEEYNYSGGGAMLVPCKVCGRKFNPDRIDKHQNASRKPKYYGTFGKKAGPPIKQKPMKKPPSKWKREHEEFISGLRAARQYSQKQQVQPQYVGAGGQKSKYGGGGMAQSKYQSQYQQYPAKQKAPPPQSKAKSKQYQQYDDDDYDPFAYKPKAPSTQKQFYRKQFDPESQQQAPSTVKPTKKANTTTKKAPQKSYQNQYQQQNYDDIQIGGGSYLEKLGQQYNRGQSRNTASKPTKQSNAVQFGQGGMGGMGGMGGGGGGEMDPKSNAHSRNLIFADSGYGNTYHQPSYHDQWQTTYSGAYAGSKQQQNMFSVPGQQKTYVDAPYQTYQNQGAAAAYQQYQKQQQQQQPKGYKFDI